METRDEGEARAYEEMLGIDGRGGGVKSADVEPNVGIACHTCLKAPVPSSLNSVPFPGHQSHASTILENAELALFSILAAALQKPHRQDRLMPSLPRL